MRRLLAMGPREDRALAFLMGACLIFFVAQWPSIARRAHLDGRDMDTDLAGALFATLFLLPLVFYAVAGLSRLLARGLGGRGTGYGARLALFWSLLAASPLVLLNGLVAGFIGSGPELTMVGGLWLAVFLWFWMRGLIIAESGAVS